MANIAALKTAIDSDPVNDPPATDEDVLAWLNALTEPRRVPIENLRRYVLETTFGDPAQSIWARLYSAKADAADPGHAVAVEVLQTLDWLADINLADARSQAMMDGLIALGICEAAHKTALVAMSANQVARWTRFAGVTKPRLGDVTAARA